MVEGGEVTSNDGAEQGPTAQYSVTSLVARTDDVVDPGSWKEENELQPTVNPRPSRLSVLGLSGVRGVLDSSNPRPSILFAVAAEVTTFYDVFGFLGIPMIVVFMVSAAWTFMLAVIQANADTMANTIMNTTNFDKGEFWLLPKPEPAIIISSVVLLSLFGIGYTALAVTMLFFYHSGASKEENYEANDGENSRKEGSQPSSEVTTANRAQKRKLNRLIQWIHGIPADVRHHYYTAALDLPKLIFQTITLHTYLQDGFPTALIYFYSVLLFLNWLVACYRSQHYAVDPDLIIARLYYTFDLFFAVFAPLVVLVYFISKFQFDRAEFMTRAETLSPSTFDNVARIFGDPSQISSFCSAFHYLQFSSGTTLFYKSALNVLSLYKWRKIILTLIRNHYERQQDRKRKALVEPERTNGPAKATIRAAITKKLSASMGTLKPKLGKKVLSKLFLSLVFLVCGLGNFVYSIGSVESTTNLCSKYEKCVVASYQWNYGEKHCTCLVFADRQPEPKTYAEWKDPDDTTSNLAELAIAGELRIIQIINRAVPELPEELRKCEYLVQLIMVYTKTESLPEWMAEFSHLEYLHIEGDFTSRRLKTIADGIFDNMPHLAFLHVGTLPEVEKLPSLSSLNNLRYLTLAVLDSLQEIPSFEGLSSVSDLSIIHALRAPTLPSLTPLTSMKSMVVRARSAVCCNGFISGTCNMTEAQCLPISGEKYPLTCTDERISAADKITLDTFGRATICPPSLPLNRELSAPSKYSTDDLCDGVKYKQCELNGVQGICYNMRMMVVNCETTTGYITMRKLQIQRNVGDPCDPDLEAWLGCSSS